MEQMRGKPPYHPLLDLQDSLLIAIDVQAIFIDKLAPEHRQPLLDRMLWVTRVARWLDLPIIATAEEMDRLGGLHPQYLEGLARETSVFNKMTFGLTYEPEIMTAVRKTGRRTAVLLGLETDVCVAHSALGLMGQGYRVAVVSDATGSPGAAHEDGLTRIRNAGGLVISLRGLYYEWLRTVEATRRFRDENKDAPSPDDLLY